MDQHPIFIRLSAAMALKEAGIFQPAFFSYYTFKKTIQPRLTGTKRSAIFAPAYTAAELLGLLPGALAVDQNTWVAEERNWRHPTADELAYPYAQLKLTKTLGGSYIAAYYHHHRNIAFRKTTDGKVCNLFSGEENPADALAMLVLALVEEGRLAPSFSTEPVSE